MDGDVEYSMFKDRAKEDGDDDGEYLINICVNKYMCARTCLLLYLHILLAYDLWS